MNLRLPIVALACAGVLLSGLPAAEVRADEGLRFEVEFASSLPGDTKHERVTIWLSGRRLRIEQATLTHRLSSPVVIYRGDRDRVYSLDPRQHLYLEIDRQLLSSLTLQLQAARREMDAHLSRLPEDQHAMVERLFGAREPETPLVREPLLVVETERREQVGRHTCYGIDLVRGEVKVAEACIVAWSKLRIDRRDLEVFRQLTNFQRELMGARSLTPFEVVPDQPLDLLVQFEGLPLRFRKLKGDTETSTIRVTRLEHFDGGDELFEVPEGYALRGGGLSSLAGPAAPATPAP